jgi:hypothetical protein
LGFCGLIICSWKWLHSFSYQEVYERMTMKGTVNARKGMKSNAFLKIVIGLCLKFASNLFYL